MKERRLFFLCAGHGAERRDTGALNHEAKAEWEVTWRWKSGSVKDLSHLGWK